MRILIDSNLLLRLANAYDPQFQIAQDCVAKLLRNRDELCIVPQCIYEFWVVATRPIVVNGLGFSCSQAESEVNAFKQTYFFLSETDAFFTEWEKLVATYSIIGKNAHDTRLVAAMVVHGITHLLTFNKQDFQRFANIIVLTPADVMAMP
jgi:predicted nucleic acid-binding protein